MNQYKHMMSQIKASDHFKTDTLLKLQEEKESRYIMKYTKIIIGFAAAVVLAVGIIGFNPTNPTTFDLRDRIIYDADAIEACAAVNIEGYITEVAEDGLSFKLDNGQWIHVTDQTEIGITGPTAADQQFFEPNFRVGNMIAGWAENVEGTNIQAYVIYTNWNWDDPIR